MDIIEELDSFIELYNNCKIIGLQVNVEYDSEEQKIFLTHNNNVIKQVNNVSPQNAVKITKQIKHNYVERDL